MKSMLWKHLGPRVPRIELRRLRKIEFFPPAPPRFEDVDSLCIGTKSRTIGDALMLSTLPGKLRARYPHLKIHTFPRGFNPVVHTGSPHVFGVDYLPRALYGDDCNWGEGHLIQVKERYFDLPISDFPKPEIHLLQKEERWIESYLARHLNPASHGKPLCLIHPWGHTHSTVSSLAFWEERIRQWSPRMRFWQVGIEGHAPIPGCEHHFLLPRPFHHARKLFALTSRADLFIGVDSGPMHAARAFEVPSFILTNYGRHPEEIFRLRKDHPWFMFRNWRHGFLYEQNENHDVTLTEPVELIRSLDRFIELFMKPLPVTFDERPVERGR